MFSFVDFFIIILNTRILFSTDFMNTFLYLFYLTTVMLFIIMRLIIKNPHLIKNNHFYWYCNSFQNKMTPTNPVRVILLRYQSCRNLPINNGILTNYKLLNLGFINNEYLRYPPRAVPHVHTNVHLTPKFWKNIVQKYT